jgi:dCMP deaminase
MTTSEERWDQHFLEDAFHVARKSKDRSTKCGAVIVSEDHVQLSAGWNGFPRGVDDNVEHRHERPAKYDWTEHAERNAIYNAARHGVALKGSTIYLTGSPCSVCARAIIQVGITRVVIPPGSGNLDKSHHQSTFSLELAELMLIEAGVSVMRILLPHWKA